MRTTIDKAGRLVIPKPFRDRLGLVGEVELSDDGSALRVEAVAGSGLATENGRQVIPSSAATLTGDDVRELRRADQK